MLKKREFKALENLQFSLVEYEDAGKLGLGVGRKTIDSLIRQGLIIQGVGSRGYGRPGYKITDEGKRILNEEYARRSPARHTNGT